MSPTVVAWPATLGALAAAKANVASGRSAISVPSPTHAEADPQPVDQRVDHELDGGGLLARLERRAAPGRCPRRTTRRIATSVVGMSSCFRKNQRAGYIFADFLAVLGDGDVRRDHLLLAVVGDPQRVEPRGEVADLHRLPRLQQQLLRLLEALAGEAEEHQDDADVDDVAAVAPLVAPHQADERGEDIGAGGLLPHPRAAPELLARWCRPRSRTARSTCPALQNLTPSAITAPPTTRPLEAREQELIPQVRQRGLAPREQRPDAGQQQQDQADRHHPLR